MIRRRIALSPASPSLSRSAGTARVTGRRISQPFTPRSHPWRAQGNPPEAPEAIAIEEWKPQLSESEKNTKLITHTHVSERATGWHRAAFEDIADRLTDSGFPCVFSRNAFRKKLLRFIFVENSERSGLEHLAAGLKEYVEISREWDGQLDTAYPLAVAFSQDAVKAQTVEEYHAFGWKVLQELHDLDPGPWPDEVGKDPDADGWSMCFDSMPLFCNMSSPAHTARRSRNLGEYFFLIVNPRERFDVFAGETPSGRKVRANIRNRIARYDSMPHAMQLGSYGAGALEWYQYGLIEENAPRSDECPFKFRGA
ncbi:YqcI/YcgG family protein [Streptomyces alboniger]|uniref:YqcI/YcgG family protein n=1 Tax=Streptomyces alboniger TaxID=132473 RepID=UPI001BC8BE70|nr:YqcI/YcgG family protein [Streptomyces alboniger]